MCGLLSVKLSTPILFQCALWNYFLYFIDISKGKKSKTHVTLNYYSGSMNFEIVILQYVSSFSIVRRKLLLNSRI